MSVMRLLALTAAALAAVACGSTSSSRPTGGASLPSRVCAVKVYFAPGAARARELVVESRLRASEHVARVTFLSKRVALRIMRKKYPALVKSLPYNPLPDALLVTPKPGDVAAVREEIRRAHYAGVDKVGRAAPPCRG